ncbi:MAG: hypothetical protein SVS85_04170, partial [Candidatus Nanohaloarchaea archaeon]|nr:hypothetical protein [Candidatus Nanohaloarchaea archaeon]
FTINASVTCRDADCGTVQGTARYNTSGLEPDTAVSDVEGTTPFYTHGSNPKTCGTMSQGESCTLMWTANASGCLGDQYSLDVRFGGDVPANDTGNSRVEIGKVLILNVSANKIDWGKKDPSLNSVAAPNNPIRIGLDPASNDASGLYIRGTDLTNDSESTVIGVSNISWCVGCAGPSTATAMRNDYSLIRENVESGDFFGTDFWLSTPPVYRALYTGKMTIKANTTW